MRWPWRRYHRVILTGPYLRADGSELWRCDCAVCSWIADANRLERAVDASLTHVGRNDLTIRSPEP